MGSHRTAKKITLEHGVENTKESFPSKTKKAPTLGLENKCHTASLKELSFWSSLQRVEKHIIEWLFVDKVFASERISDKCSEFIIIKIQSQNKISHSSQ